MDLSILIIGFNILNLIIDHILIVFIVVIDTSPCLEFFQINVVIITFFTKLIVIRIIYIINDFKSIPI